MGVPTDLADLDLATALSRVGGDEELLKEIAEIFLEQCPDDLSEVRQAVATNNAEALQHAAHTLKGAVSNFGAKAAYDAAYRLEMMGRESNLRDSNQALTELEQALEVITPQLARLASS